MEEKNNNNKRVNVSKRTDLLTVLSILSFIWGGLSFLSNFILYLFNSQVHAVIKEEGLKQFFGVDMNLEALLNVHPLFFLLQALFAAMSVLGVAMMWRLNRLGFHVYTIAQIILLIIPNLFISGLPFPLFELSVAALFVYLYGKSLKIY